MNRRHFIALSGVAGLATMTSAPKVFAAQNGGRDFYELRQFVIEKEEQKKLLDKFFKDSLIPALNRQENKPVGVFYPEKGLGPIYLLLRYKSWADVSATARELASDSDFVSSAKDFLDTPPDAPAYKRMESSIMVAFEGMPNIETPVKNPERVFQLRIYESPSIFAGLKKIEMFNDAGEIRIFREVGLNPVFFGQTIAGAKMPNLTYMLAFKSMEDQKAAWQKFGAHPDWKRLSKMPEYADKTILSGITNIQLTAAPYSQV